jgi:hypothetical protein
MKTKIMGTKKCQVRSRILGTAVGAAISAVDLTVLPFSPLGMAASIYTTVLLCHRNMEVTRW